MPANEHEHQRQHEQTIDREALDEVAERAREQIAEKLEQRSPEKSHGDTTRLAKEALQEARSEKEAGKEKAVYTHEVHHQGPATKRQQVQAFEHIMSDARSHMSPSAKAFSKVIHHPTIEKISDVTGRTIARPNAILTGSIFAFTLVLIFFLVARYYGYPLSGTETIVAFAIGWLLGIVYDFLRAMITGGR